MTSSSNFIMSAGAEPQASRREIVTAAVTAAVAATAASGSAEAQTSPMLRFFNPPGMSSPPTYSHVVEVNGPHRTVYLAGQTGVDATGKVAEGFRAQATQVMENLKTALASVGGGFEHVVKLNRGRLVTPPRRGPARLASKRYFNASIVIARRACLLQAKRRESG